MQHTLEHICSTIAALFQHVLLLHCFKFYGCLLLWSTVAAHFNIYLCTWWCKIVAASTASAFAALATAYLQHRLQHIWSTVGHSCSFFNYVNDVSKTLLTVLQWVSFAVLAAVVLQLWPQNICSTDCSAFVAQSAACLQCWLKGFYIAFQISRCDMIPTIGII